MPKPTSVHHCAVSCISQRNGPRLKAPRWLCTTQMATKLFTVENKQGNFDNGDKAILMPQLGQSQRSRFGVLMLLAGELWL